MSELAPDPGARWRRAMQRGAAATMVVAALASSATGQVPAPTPAPVPPSAPAPAPPDTVPPPAADTAPPPPPPARRAHEDLRAAWRFEVADVGDSTFRFGVAGVPWVRAGARGILVDPRRRDALVARFAVERITADTATALVVGQTQRVVTEHVALLSRPTEKAWRQRPFWQGAVAGALTAGVLTAFGFLVTR